MQYPIIKPEYSPKIQQIIIDHGDTLNIFPSSPTNPMFKGRHIYETPIIVGVSINVEMMICHFKIDSIDPDLLLAIFNFKILKNLIQLEIKFIF